MASMPEYSAGHRTRSTDATDGEQERAPGATNDSEIEEVEAVVFNREQPLSEQNPTTDTTTPETTTTTTTPTTTTNNTPKSVADTDNEVRRCWICYTDETEDSPLNAEWRSPCPCALTAHEACLLDWLADMENPRARNRNARAAQMTCPQCKSEIVVTRPRSYVVDLVRFLERMAGRLVLPGMAFTLAGTVWAGCCAHGVYSMYFVFGTDEARRIFEESVTVDGYWNPGLNLGLPFIPLVLIFSRTRYAEGLLPAIPVLFFASQGSAPEREVDLWPPSAAVTFAALPYVKSFYATLYEKLFGKLERRWIAEVQPRAGEFETEEQLQQHQEDTALDRDNNNNDQVLMEIDLELQVGLGRDEDDAQEAPAEGGGGEGEGGGGGDGGGRQRPGDNNGQMLGLGRGQNELVADTGSLLDTVLGALVFPAVSAGMGGLLKYVLPKSWTAISSSSSSSSSTFPSSSSSSILERGRPTLLQTRWGRSVIGGCIFVLLKDALVLYCRWKLAQTHRKRRVLNYDRKNKKKVEGR